MQTVYWRLLLALTCWYPVRAEVPVQPNFDTRRFAGPWYPIQLVIDKDGEIKPVVIAGRTAIPKSNGDIDMDGEVLVNGECIRKMTPFLHTDTPGVFTTEGSTIHVVETDYNTYHILHVATKLNKILHLEARHRGVSESVKKKFKDLAISLGFLADQIVDVRQTGHCSYGELR